MAIGEFQGQHRFLSNFYPCRIEYLTPGGGMLIFYSTEAFFQAMKTLDWGNRRRIAAMRNPAEAKRAGRSVAIRPDWDNIKRDVMLYGLRLKFRNSVLRAKLLATAGSELVEGNRWNDKFWGVCLKTGQGENWLGRLLMQVRDEIAQGR
jgi:ribA/ribD-fused uncharacterized protein